MMDIISKKIFTIINKLSKNQTIFELDYNAIKIKCNIYKKELLEKTIFPSRITQLLELDIPMEELGLK
jgi:hypothetical protein